MMFDTLCPRCNSAQAWPVGALCEPCKTAEARTATETLTTDTRDAAPAGAAR